MPEACPPSVRPTREGDEHAGPLCSLCQSTERRQVPIFGFRYGQCGFGGEAIVLTYFGGGSYSNGGRHYVRASLRTAPRFDREEFRLP
jgi:hypothetical protein